MPWPVPTFQSTSHAQGATSAIVTPAWQAFQSTRPARMPARPSGVAPRVVVIACLLAGGARRAD
ncbi:MAG: hypothetical protein ABSH49_28980 [Bryobacteraceae bacterium]